MALEIERKFLIDTSILSTLRKGQRITQGYLPTEDKTVVRVRIQDTQAFLTLKGKNQGAKRTEFEYGIPLQDAQEMIREFCPKATVDKVRYELNIDQHCWEIDVFEGSNAGLVVAEIELSSEDETFTRPSWVKQEVTDDPRYYNSNLIDNPFSQW